MQYGQTLRKPHHSHGLLWSCLMESTVLPPQRHCNKNAKTMSLTFCKPYKNHAVNTQEKRHTCKTVKCNGVYNGKNPKCKNLLDFDIYCDFQSLLWIFQFFHEFFWHIACCFVCSNCQCSAADVIAFSHNNVCGVRQNQLRTSKSVHHFHGISSLD